MTEAEYVATSDAMKEALRLGGLVCMFQQANPNSAPVIYTSNQSVVAVKNRGEMILCSGIDMKCVCVCVCERE